MDSVSAWITLLAQSLGGGLLLCLEILAILAPLMIGYELIKVYGVLERPWPRLRKALGGLGLGPGSLVPLLAGLFLGILYGAGILVATSEEEGLGRRERLALAVFLVVCHAVVEDTAIFVLLGGNALWILGSRLALACALTIFLAHRWRRGKA